MFCHRKNQIRLIMSLMNLGLTLDPLVRTIFTLFSLRFDNSIGRVSGLGSGVFIQTGVESKCDIFVFFVFVPMGVESKGGQLIEMFWRSNSLFSFQI